MKLKFVEATNREHGGFNWGKFLVARFDTEWQYKSAIDGFPLLHARGWSPEHIVVFDIETGEGAIFRPGGLADYDLDQKHIWVCPMFEPFLAWLYKQDLTDIDTLPVSVVLDAPSAMQGYRRNGRPDTFTNQVWCLIFSMVERGVPTNDPWFGEHFLKVKGMLEDMGLNCDPEKAQGGIEPPPELHDKIRDLLKARTNPN